MRSTLSLAVLTGLLGGPFPLRPAIADEPRRPTPVSIRVDTTGAPETAAWAEKARALSEAWYPRIAEILASDGFTPPDRVKLVFQSGTKGIAGTAGSTIFISADYVNRHPDDLGMVIHELTHVVQSYPRVPRGEGWLVEGIADYVRFVRYEPGTPQPPIDPARSSYRDGYRTAFRFLDWVARTYDTNLIPTLNAALRRRGGYRPELFYERTGRSLDTLWNEFVATLPRPPSLPKAPG